MSSFFEVFSPTSGEAPTRQTIETEEELEEEPEVVQDPVESTVMPSSSSSTPSTAPKYGGMHLKTPWIGGAPTEDWSSSSLAGPATPYCFRAEDPVSQMRAYGRRVEGNEVKFKRDDADYTLLSFATDPLSHHEEHGMDSVFYMSGVDTNGEGDRDLFSKINRKSHLAKRNFLI